MAQQRTSGHLVDQTRVGIAASRRQSSPMKFSYLRLSQWCDRRAEARYPTSDPATLHILPAGSWVRATVEDVSESGLRLAMKTEVPLHKGMRIEIALSGEAKIFGEVRHCRRMDGVLHAGILILHVDKGCPASDHHIHDDQLSLYLLGKGLGVSEVMFVNEHLLNCRDCRERMLEAAASLNQLHQALPDGKR
jgi:hypothetical protein